METCAASDGSRGSSVGLGMHSDSLVKTIFYSTRIKDAGVAIRHSRGYIISILQGPEMNLMEWNGCVHEHKNRKPNKKTYFFRMEKYIEDLRQDEKHGPDLLEAIMRPTYPIKDELRQKLFKIDQFGSNIKEMRVSKFWTPELRNFPAGGQHNLLAQ